MPLVKRGSRPDIKTPLNRKRYHYFDPTVSDWLGAGAVGVTNKRVIVENVDYLLQAGNVFKMVLEAKAERTRLEQQGYIMVSRTQRIFMVQLAKALGAKAEYVINKPNTTDYCYGVDLLKTWFVADNKTGKWLIINKKQCTRYTKAEWLKHIKQTLKLGKSEKLKAYRFNGSLV